MAVHSTGIRIKNCLLKADKLIPLNAWGKNLEETYLPVIGEEWLLSVWILRAEKACRDLTILLSLSDSPNQDKKEARKLLRYFGDHLRQYGQDDINPRVK